MLLRHGCFGALALRAQISANSGPQHLASAAEGCKFCKWCQWFSSFRSALKHQHLWMETVIPHASLRKELDQVVGFRSFVIDAASWAVWCRPRLWRSRAVEPPSHESAQPPPVLAGFARWRSLPTLGPQLWRHRECLGVPPGLHVADMICFLTLVLVFLPASHFVDDFYYSEPVRTD